MKGKILLFGFDSLLAILALESAVAPFGAELVPVARTDYNKSLAALAGEDAAGAQPYTGGPLGGRMAVLCGLDRELEWLLPLLNKAGAGQECLKAVLTEQNRRWSPVTLYMELLRERQAMGGRR